MRFRQPHTVAEVANWTQARVIGNSSVSVHGMSDVQSAKSDEAVFAANEQYVGLVLQSEAQVVFLPTAIGPEKLANAGRTVLHVEHAHHAFDTMVRKMFADSDGQLAVGRHPTAIISPTATVSEGSSIGAFCFIAEGAFIGAGTRLDPYVYIGERVRTGQGCHIGSHTTVHRLTKVGDRVKIGAGSSIGSDPYYYVNLGGNLRAGVSVGAVELSSDVELGACCTIDRGILEDTVIGIGSKLDSQVHVGHDVKIGMHVRLAAQCGIAGHSRIGDYAVLRGQVGVMQRVQVGDRVTLLGKAGVDQDVPPGSTVFGVPATTRERFVKKQRALVSRVRRLERDRRHEQSDVERRVVRTIADEASVSIEDVTHSTALNDDLSFASLDRVSLQMALEDEFDTNLTKLHLTESALLAVRTVGDVVNLVKESLTIK